jgi:hypothetical protein
MKLFGARSGGTGEAVHIEMGKPSTGVFGKFEF